MKSNDAPWKISQPCSANWDKMRGDDKRRFCDHCQKFVHNISAMSQTDRTAFANPANAHECVFYCQRNDGGIANLSMLARLRRRFPFLRMAGWSALIALLPVTLTGCMGVRIPENRPVAPSGAAVPAQTPDQPGEIKTP